MTKSLVEKRASTLWIMLLTIASTVTTLALACATPFPALSALAALHMRRSDGVWLAVAAWVASQAVGFGLLGYPHDPSTLGWGIGLGCAAVISALAAHAVADRFAGLGIAIRLGLAYVAGFIAFKAVIALFALKLGGMAISLSPSLMVEQFARNAAILLGLLALYRGLVAIGMPAPTGRLKAA
ncbi:hypothetical protein ACFB49_31730 [Sphingomonas sp. DBB INV C78]|uniref:hypothetical protein n=1 Tax=Sphingomonas sp. DBB INV C78 TaxID=3349434 RepID=UPI0036D35935